MVDPRESIINERLRSVRRIIAVSSGKGGVGKSVIASALALALAEKSCSVGMFDLDFTSPSTHVILGIEDLQPKEDKGLVPPVAYGLKYMSIIYFSGEHPMPLRGADVSNALIELLSITRWEKLDYLVLDMPPGISDITLDLIRLIRNIEFLIVTTPSRLAFETVRKFAVLLNELRVPIVGVVENMKVDESETIDEETLKLGLNYMGEIPYDAEVEDAIGTANKLINTTLGDRIRKIVASSQL